MLIAILTGGISTERNVALQSGQNMRNWCEIAGNSVDLYDIPESIDIFLEKYKEYDFVIPVLHGRYGEDGSITGMCESLWIRIAWCKSSVHALCMNKFHTNCVLEKIWILIPKSWIPGFPMPPNFLPAEDITKLETNLIVKPNQWWSSLATAKVETPQELKEAIENINVVIQSMTLNRITTLSWKKSSDFARQFPPLTDVPIVQECIEWREFTIGVYLDESGYHALPIIEISTLSHDFFDYNEKYETDGSNEIFMTNEQDLQDRLSSESLRICEFLWTWWVVRIDWRYDGKDLYFLEVNTIPGFTGASLVPKMWKKAGKSEEEFIEMLSY